MNFLYKLKQSIYSFMYGRCGIDRLGIVLMVIYFVLSILTGFFEGTVAFILYFLSLAVFIYFLYRFLSRDLAKRQAENTKTIIFLNKVKNMFKKDIKDKNKVIRKCPDCKAKIRLPKKKGRHSVTCPRCKVTFNVKI
ncbi:MAG: hypothetical protein UHN02_03855 [Acutalibacteraceae bacterium]|nr:hypothetical protein [Acutalibacteraceae bacterium]